MAQVNIDIAKQITSDEINGKVDVLGATADTGGSATEGTVMGKLNNLIKSNEFTDIDLIKMSTNYINATYTLLPLTETELLSVTGEGAITNIFVEASASINYIKVYIDDELRFDFSVKSVSSINYRRLCFGRIAYNSSAYVDRISDMTGLINGNQLTSNAYYILFPFLIFKKNFKILGYSSVSNDTTKTIISYSLKE